MEYPDKLNEDGQYYWDLYMQYLQTPNKIQLKVLEDLCYWEMRKEQAISDLDKIGRDFIAYLDADKKPKHTQPVAPMTNLKKAQEKVLKIRDKLFDKEILKNEFNKEASNSSLKSVKNF